MPDRVDVNDPVLDLVLSRFPRVGAMPREVYGAGKVGDRSSGMVTLVAVFRAGDRYYFLRALKRVLPPAEAAWRGVPPDTAWKSWLSGWATLTGCVASGPSDREREAMGFVSRYGEKGQPVEEMSDEE